MDRDPIIDEIHKVREELLARFDYDIDRLLAHMNAEARKSGREMISLPPRKPNLLRVQPPPPPSPLSDAA